MDVEQFRRAGYRAIDRICDHFYSLEKKSVVPSVNPGYLRAALPDQAPEKGEDFSVIEEDYQNLIIPGLTHWQHPSFFAYFPTACTFEGILGDLYASSTPNPGFNWSASPACTELEAVVMDWSAKLLGLDEVFYNTNDIGGGVIQTSASEAALVAVIAAKSRYMHRNPGTCHEDLIIYTTTQTHSLGAKAGLILGVKVRALDVTANDAYSLRGESLQHAIEEDKRDRKHPFILIATVGTTSAGAIDRINEIGLIKETHPDTWIHIDAAWTGLAMVCPEYRDAAQLPAINAFADSFCTNFHKWGLVNFDASGLWIRNRRDLTSALDITPEFLRTKHGDAGTVIDYRNWHLGLGRRFRSLKLWFVLRGYGVEGFQKYIRETIRLSQSFVSLIESSPDFALVAPPSFALSVFRLEPKHLLILDASRDLLNDLNKHFYERLSSRHDILLTQTQFNGMFCIRLAVGSAYTTDAHIRKAFELLSSEANATLREWQQPAITLKN